MNPDEQDDVSTQGSAPSDDSQQSTQPQADSSPDRQPDAPPESADAKADQPPAQQQRTDAKSSSPNSIPVASNTQSRQGIPADAPSEDSYKRLREAHGQLNREALSVRKQLEEQRLQLTQFQQEREKNAQAAKNQKLALYDPRHPEHTSKFAPLQAKADIVRQQLQALSKTRPPEGLTPEQGQAWREASEQALLSTLTEEDQNTLSQFQQHKQSFDREWAMNPDKVLTERVIPMIRQEMQRAMMETQATASVQKDFEDPELGPILKEMGSEMNEAIQRLGGTDDAYDFVKQQAVVYAHNKKANDFLSQENARLKQQLEEAGLRLGTAKTQQELAKGRASVTRDVSTKQHRDPYLLATEWAAKNRVDKTSPMFHQKLRELSSH